MDFTLYVPVTIVGAISAGVVHDSVLLAGYALLVAAHDVQGHQCPFYPAGDRNVVCFVAQTRYALGGDR